MQNWISRGYLRAGCVMVAAMLMAAPAVRAGDWPHWRGPFFNGSTDETNLPEDWSRTEGIAWKTELPGPSAATPIVLGDRVFVSSVDAAKEGLAALCLDRATGKILWSRDIAQGVRQDNKSTYAAPSPVTDGKVVVFFYSTGDLVCFDLDGGRKWARNIQDEYGPFAFQWTFSTSPTLYEGILYMQVLQRDVPARGRGFKDRKNESYILALNPETGKELWRHVRPSKAKAESLEAFSTPLPFTIGGKTQLVVVGGDAVSGHDLKSGKELWRWGTWNPERVGHWRLVPSAVVGGGVVLVCAPKREPVYAVRVKGTGALGDGAVAWGGPDSDRKVSSDVPTPAFYDGDFFVLNDLDKNLSRLDAATGEVKWTVPAPGKDKYRASPTAADGKVYTVNHAGEVTIFNAADGRALRTISMDDPAGPDVVRSSIVAAHGQLFIRTTRHLYCVGKGR